MGVVRHKVKKGRNHGMWHFCSDMAVHIPGEIWEYPHLPLFNTDSEFYNSNSHRLLYPAHPSFLLKSFIVLLARQQIDG